MEDSLLGTDEELPHSFDFPFEFCHQDPEPETEPVETLVLPPPDELRIAGNFVSQYLNPVILQERARIKRHDAYLAKCREEKKVPRHVPGMAAHRFTLRLLEKFCMEYCNHASLCFSSEDQQTVLENLIVTAAPCMYQSEIATVRTGLGPACTAALFCT